MEDQSYFKKFPTQAMRWLFSNKNSLVVMANIIGKKGLNHLHFISKIKLKDDECYFDLKNIKTKPLLTRSKIDTSIKNLEKYGFIKILQTDFITKINGIKKIKVVVNPFDYETAKFVQENYSGGFPEFK